MFKDGKWEPDPRKLEAFRRLRERSGCNHDTAKHWRRCPTADLFECTKCGAEVTGQAIYAEAIAC